MAKRKYCYGYTKHRQYKCCECGRTKHEPTKHPTPINISYSVDMDKEKFDELALALRLYDKSIKVRRGINGIIHIYSEKMAENLDDPLDYYRQLCHKVNCALAYFAIVKQRKKIFGI